MKKYFLYRHIRLDKNEPFYIGIGTKPNSKKIKGYKTEYSRAFETTKRSDYWKNIFRKTRIEVEILMESDDHEFIKEKEIEFIALYGRKSLQKDGILVNFSAGGDPGGRPRNSHVEVEQYDLSGNLIKIWKELKHIQEQTGWLKTNIVKVCRKKQLTAYGYVWKYANNKSFDHKKPSASRKSSVQIHRHGLIVQFSTEIKYFKNVKSLAEYIGCNSKIVYKAFRNKTFDYPYYFLDAHEYPKNVIKQWIHSKTKWLKKDGKEDL